MPVYHKLVRDQIPGIIKKDGKTCTVRTLGAAEYIVALNVKLDEELAEYHAADEAHALEELADLVEVIRAVTVARGFSLDELEATRATKALKRGGFEQRLLLVEVTEAST